MSKRYIPEKIRFTKQEEFNNEKAVSEYQSLMERYKITKDTSIKEKVLEIRNKIVIQNLPLVFKKVSEVKHPNEIHEDLINTGAIALINAIDKYDSKEETVFSTYAGKSILQGIIDEVDKYYGDNSKKYGSALRKYRSIAIKYFGFSSIIYDNDVIDFVLGIMQEQGLLEFVTIDSLKVRLLAQKEVFEQEEESVEIEQDQDIEDEIIFIRKKQEELFKTLSVKERIAVEYILGFKDGKTHTSQEVADMYGISRQAVNQRYNSGIEKMRLKVKKIENV